MRKLMKVSLMITVVVSLMLLTNRSGPAQKLPKHIYIQASAMGTSTQLGRVVSVNLIIEELSGSPVLELPALENA